MNLQNIPEDTPINKPENTLHVFDGNRWITWEEWHARMLERIFGRRS